MGDGPPFFCFVCDLLVLCIVLLCKMRVFVEKMAGFCGFLIKRACFVEKRCVGGVGVLFWRWYVRKSVGVGSCVVIVVLGCVDVLGISG